MNDVKTIYNQLRIKITRDIKSSKKLYWSAYFSNYKHDMRKTWKGIKDLVNTKTAGITNISQFKVNGKEINDPKIIGNTFNFFANVGPNTDKTIPKPFKSPSSYLKNRINFENVGTMPNLTTMSTDKFIFYYWVPDAKVAKVFPIFKSGFSDDMNNYRPISLLSVFSKLTEKIMHARL